MKNFRNCLVSLFIRGVSIINSNPHSKQLATSAIRKQILTIEFRVVFYDVTLREIFSKIFTVSRLIISENHVISLFFFLQQHNFPQFIHNFEFQPFVQKTNSSFQFRTHKLICSKLYNLYIEIQITKFERYYRMILGSAIKIVKLFQFKRHKRLFQNGGKHL